MAKHGKVTRHFLRVLPVAVARSSADDNVLCTSGFVDDVTFADNGPYGASYTQSDSPGGSTVGAKCDHYDCLVRICRCDSLSDGFIFCM